jgi:hypothetical protein
MNCDVAVIFTAAPFLGPLISVGVVFILGVATDHVLESFLKWDYKTGAGIERDA